MDFEKIVVSVIIPVYNSEDTILKAINSVLEQTYDGPVEIIVVNDGSTDNSLAILKNFQSENLSVPFFIIDQLNGGVSSARNAGLKVAKGEYIAFLDSDDIWLPDKLKKQIMFLEKNLQYSFVGCLHNSIVLKSPYKIENDVYIITIKKMLVKMAPQTSTALVRKEVFLKSGIYDENQKYAEDGNLWFRIAFNHKMAILPESLVFAGAGKPGFGHSGLSAKIWLMQKGEMKNILELLKYEKISLFQFLIFSSYSLLKFLRRVIIVTFRKNI